MPSICWTLRLGRFLKAKKKKNKKETHKPLTVRENTVTYKLAPAVHLYKD